MGFVGDILDVYVRTIRELHFYIYMHYDMTQNVHCFNSNDVQLLLIEVCVRIKYR